MNYDVEITALFKKQSKRLVKKYPSFKKELEHIISLIEINPHTGISLGNNCFKIRIAISSKSKGKSGGARIITHLKVQRNKVYLLAVYDKPEQENISDKELIELLKFIS